MILGTIQSVISGTGITVLIDGETEPTAKKYMWLAPYRPTVGDRVLIEEISGSYIILGKVSNNFVDSMTSLVRNNINGADNGLVSFGIKGGELYFGLAPYDGSSYTLYKLKKA
jgi:hypothetical protein